MKLILQHVHVRPADRLDWVAPHLLHLQPLLAIEAAYLRLEYRAGASPAFHASLHLVIPGPDIRLEAVDHTARTAAARLLAELRLRARQHVARRNMRRGRRDALVFRPAGIAPTGAGSRSLRR